MADLKVSLDALVTIVARDEQLALAGPGLLHARPGASLAAGLETGAGSTQREAPSLLCAGVTPKAGQPGPTGALA